MMRFSVNSIIAVLGISARVMAGASVCFILYFVLGHAFAGELPVLEQLTGREKMGFLCFFLITFGLFFAIFKPFWGGLVTMLGLTGFLALETGWPFMAWGLVGLFNIALNKEKPYRKIHDKIKREC